MATAVAMPTHSAIAPSKWDLKAKPKITKPKPRLVLIGEPGIGKSTFGANAPGAVFIPTEDGTLGLDVARLPSEGKCESWADIIHACKLLLQADHDFQWVVIDTINGAEHLCSEHVCQRDFGGTWMSSKGQEGYNAFGKGDKATAQEMRQLLSLLDNLQQKRGMGVILLGHVGMHKQANALGADFYKFGGEMNKNSWSLVCSWADQVGFACREVRAAKKEGEKFAKASAIGSERYLLFEGGPALDAKSRAGYEMPERILLSWEAYTEAMKANRIEALVQQADELLRATSDGVKAKVAERLGGAITADALRAIGKAKLETLIGWLLAQQTVSE